jgi:hypothetical protein
MLRLLHHVHRSGQVHSQEAVGPATIGHAGNLDVGAGAGSTGDGYDHQGARSQVQMTGGVVPDQILDFLKIKGEQLDRDIAAGLGLSLAHVQSSLERLATQGAIVMCRSIRFQDGRQVEGARCRLASYLPATFPGRRSY